ncbi:MAG: transposase [Deltaproteobacteria bacterium]|nr:transposase [Deltaproteobacteria bacterium]
MIFPPEAGPFSNGVVPDNKRKRYKGERRKEGKRFSPKQIIRIVKELEVGIKKIEICRKLSEQTFYNWKKISRRYGDQRRHEAKDSGR